MNTQTNSGTNVNVNAPNALMQNVQAFKSGEMPPNAQLLQTMQSTKQSLDEAKYEGNLSTKGQTLVDDAKAVLDSASRMISEKNHDQKLQKIVGNSIQASKDTRVNVSASDIPVGRDDLRFAQGEAREVYTALKEVVVFAVRSGQFRDMILDMMDLLQNILKSTQDKLANQSEVRPGELANQMKGETFFTEEYKQSLWAKFKTMIIKMGQHPEYYNAVDHLFTVVDQFEQKATQMKTTAQTTTATSSVPTDKYRGVWDDCKALLEEFSGNGSVDMFTNRSKVLVGALRQDQEARNLLWEARAFLRDTVKQPTLLEDQSRQGMARSLIDRARWLLQGKHRQSFSDVFDSLRLILTNIQNDSATQDFSSKLQKFVTDFALDSQGRPDLFVLQESLGQLKSIVIPVLTKQLANLPIPRIEGSNPKYDFAIDGLLLNVVDLLPDFVNISTKTDTRMNVQRLKSQKNSAKIIMEVDQIRAFFRDIKFMYRRKKMPRIEDHGVADVDISQGTGISLKMVWKVKSVGGQPLQLKLVRVKCNIARLVITIKNAKHRVVDKLVTKLFAGTIKRQMANAIVNNIIKTVQPLGVRFNEILKRKPTTTGVMERANDGMKTTLFSGNTGEPTSLSRATDAVKSGIDSAKHKVAEYKENRNTNTMNTNTMSTATTTTAATTYSKWENPEPFTTNTIYAENVKPTTRQWNFEWYNPSLQYDSFDSEGMSIPVTSDDTFTSVPVNQMSGMKIDPTSTQYTQGTSFSSI